MSTESRGHRKSVAQKVASAVLGLLVVVAVLLVALGFLARPGKDGISRLAGHPILTVLSGSMTPVFHPGDMLIDDPVNRDQSTRLAAGDIITFHVPGSATELITHKIIAVKATSAGVRYETKGVANNAPDANLVTPDQVVGTYHGHLRFGGYFLQAVQKKIVFFFLIFLPLLYLIASELKKRWHEPAAADDSSIEASDSQAGGFESADRVLEGVSAFAADHGTGEGGRDFI